MAEARLFLPRTAAEGMRCACPDALGALTAEVTAIVDDPAVGEEEVARALLRGLLAAAAATRLPGLAAEARLPFGPGQEHAALPADLQHGPTDAFLLPGRGRIRILPDPAALRRTPRLAAGGPVRFAAPGAGRLFVLPVPQTSVDIAVGYYRLPDLLAGYADKPSCLPPHLAGRLLVSFACRELFERLEEGAEGKKTQTRAYGARYAAALAELVGLYGPATVQAEPVDVPSVFGEGWL
ncbi:hypothetical protein [Solidesulfovibrio sp.]|uniref:phage adaptor protein n=1 Tax=Solidesulfovibrio sp. TaxID=2910990 RepID=UPI002B1F645E|nr:hypothetical protein [Solidesulfovibrio sp.]MEA5090598.1 hypothetical protein [Solidesulfovibrio sp.]